MRRWMIPLVLSLAACASPPPSTAVAGGDCATIAESMAAQQQAQRSAEADRQQAWKAVVPFVVAARYASAGAAGREAESRQRELLAQADAQGCPRHEH